MKIREVILSNFQDAKQEFEYDRISHPSLDDLSNLKSNINFRIENPGKEASDFIREIITNFPSGRFWCTERSRVHINCFLSIAPSAVSSFLKALNGSTDKGIKEICVKIEEILERRSLKRWEYNSQGKSFVIETPVMMGILNVTPDSFSDGGKFLSPDAAVRHAIRMLESGAQIIDVGGESTRPGAESVPLKEEWRRIAPVIQQLSREECLISVDTYKSEVARRAILEGAHIINDISGLGFDPRMAKVAEKYQVPVIIMHIKGTPKDMQKNPHYDYLVEEIFQFFQERIQFALRNNIQQLILDPGIGFGKRLNDNFEIIRRVGEFKQLGFPILLGPSRKSFIGNTLNLPPSERLIGTVTTVILGILNGAHIIRVHDVEEIRQSLEILKAILENKAG